MKLKLTMIALLSLTTISMARAELAEKEMTNEMREQVEKETNENLINKIETAQKEQFLKFMQKKQNVQDSEYI